MKKHPPKWRRTNAQTVITGGLNTLIHALMPAKYTTIAATIIVIVVSHALRIAGMIFN